MEEEQKSQLALSLGIVTNGVERIIPKGLHTPFDFRRNIMLTEASDIVTIYKILAFDQISAIIDPLDNEPILCHEVNLKNPLNPT